MSLTPEQLIQLGQDMMGGLDSRQQQNQDALNLYGYYNRISTAGGANFSNSINRLTGVSLGQAIARPDLPTIDKMPDISKQRAELVKTSHVLHKKGINSALKRMRENSPNFILDTALSNDEFIVAVNKNTGKVEIAFRGTDPKAKIQSGFGKGLPEWTMWGSVLSGHEGRLYNQHNLENIIEQITEKYPVEQIEHISGYSMGATKAHRMGDILNKDTTLLNPFLGDNFFKNKASPSAKHTIFRTTEDVASLQGLARKKLPTNVTVNNIDPIAVIFEKNRAKNPFSRGIQDIIKHHDIDHFVGEGNRTSEIREANDKINERLKQFHNETRNVTPEQRTQLQSEMLREIEPEMKTITEQTVKVKSHQGFMKGVTRGAIGLGASGGAYVATEELLKEFGIDDEYTTAGIAGGVAGGVGERTFNQLAGLGAMTNVRNAVLSGGVGAVAQVGSAHILNEALLNAGVSRDVASVVSESVGGGVGGGTSAVMPMAISRAGQMVAINASRLAIPGLVSGAEVAGAEVAGAELTAGLLAETTALEVGAEVAGAELAVAGTEALAVGAGLAGTEAVAGGVVATNWWNPVGWVAGAVLVGTVIAGGIAIASAKANPAVDYVLHPTRSQAVDILIANDETVKQIINDFNDRQDFSDEALNHLENQISMRALEIPGIPKDYGYNPRLVPAPDGHTSRQGIVYQPYDYSQIPSNVASMNGRDFEKAIGSARLYSEYPVEYRYLTDAQKHHITEEIVSKHPELARDRDFRFTSDINYRLARALEIDTADETKAERDAIIQPIIQAEQEAERQRQAVERAIADYNETMAITNEEHRIFAQFLNNSPEVNNFINNGDINGLNRFIHAQTSNPLLINQMFAGIHSENREKIRNIFVSNIPQFNAIGEINYISTADRPVEISTERQRMNIEEAQSRARMTAYSQDQNIRRLAGFPLGNLLLQDPEIAQAIRKGNRPEEINQLIQSFIKSNPEISKAVNSGRTQYPTFTEDSIVMAVYHDTHEDTHIQEHRKRRMKRHQMITEKETPQPTQVTEVETAPQQSEQNFEELG